MNNTIEIRCSQEAIVNWAQTSTFFLHSVIYRDFFANEVQHRKLSKILATMKHRWGAARGEGQILGTKCHCGQYFKSIIHALSHRNCKNSNCARAKIFQVDACKAIDSELNIPPNLMCCMSFDRTFVDGFEVSPSSLTSLVTEGVHVWKEAINAAIHMFHQLHKNSSYHFDLRFMHSLLDNSGFNFAAVRDWTGSTNIFTKPYVYFSIVYNKRHILIVVYTAHRRIDVYDPLNVSHLDTAKIILRYLFDEHQLMHNKVHDEAQPILLFDFKIDDWILSNVFTKTTNFKSFDPVNSGVYHLKFIQLLHQETHDLSSLSDVHVRDYRKELLELLINYFNIKLE